MAKAKITVTGSTFGLPPGLRPEASKPLSGTTATRPQVPVGWVRLQPDLLPELSVFCELGDDVPDADSGYGGIVTVARQMDTAISRFGGFDAYTVPMELVMDAGATGGTIDDLYDNLEAIAGRGRKRRSTGPLKVLVDTAGLFRSDTSQFPDERWWVSALSWSKDPDDQETNGDGSRVRAVATITLTQVVEATSLLKSSTQARIAHQAKSGASGKTYESVEGDTLIKVARKKLGDAGRWPQLAALNAGIRDPNKTLKSGTRIRLP